MPTPLDPHDSKIIEWMRNQRTSAESQFDTDAAWSRFQRQHDVRAPKRLTPLGRQSVVWRIAAVLLIAVGAATYWGVRSMRTNATMVERVAANGQRTVITLDDGTRVTLNGGSRLRYPTGASQRDRDVYLEGEAFFEVTHDPRRAFRVHAGRGVVQDIGTRFNVRAYPGGPAVEVVVTEGIVELRRDSSSTPPLQLRAGEGGMLDASGATRKMDVVSTDRHVGWTTGSLVLDNVTLRAAAAELERWYGVRIVVDSSLAARPVAARFHGETIGQALDAITLALGARYEHSDSTYTIRPRAR